MGKCTEIGAAIRCGTPQTVFIGPERRGKTTLFNLISGRIVLEGTGRDLIENDHVRRAYPGL